ncbi:hypothetical protein HPP92_022347 [Vanilla planifolia]|uniref:Uncharacterized protein n=1 Tax=Vanilla planifolia TaxID=51239 RepID=A0A835UDQ4_VANPL|nr:hypothetical protein HPP92_022347 [Vanilla planifolia]
MRGGFGLEKDPTEDCRSNKQASTLADSGAIKVVARRCQIVLVDEMVVGIDEVVRGAIGVCCEQETSFNCLRQGKVIPTSTPTLVRITKEDLCDHAWGFHFNEVLSKYPAVCSQYNSAPDAEKGGTVPFFPVF